MPEPCIDRAKPTGLDQALKALLDDLDEVAQLAPEIFTCRVQEEVQEAIEAGFLQMEPEYLAPRTYGLRGQSRRVNQALRLALNRFLEQATAAGKQEGLLTPQARLTALEGAEVTSARSSSFIDFFDIP